MIFLFVSGMVSVNFLFFLSDGKKNAHMSRLNGTVRSVLFYVAARMRASGGRGFCSRAALASRQGDGPAPFARPPFARPPLARSPFVRSHPYRDFARRRRCKACFERKIGKTERTAEDLFRKKMGLVTDNSRKFHPEYKNLFYLWYKNRRFSIFTSFQKLFFILRLREHRKLRDFVKNRLAVCADSKETVK